MPRGPDGRLLAGPEISEVMRIEARMERERVEAVAMRDEELIEVIESYGDGPSWFHAACNELLERYKLENGIGY